MNFNQILHYKGVRSCKRAILPKDQNHPFSCLYSQYSHAPIISKPSTSFIIRFHSSYFSPEPSRATDYSKASSQRRECIMIFPGRSQVHRSQETGPALTAARIRQYPSRAESGQAQTIFARAWQYPPFRNSCSFHRVGNVNHCSLCARFYNFYRSCY